MFGLTNLFIGLGWSRDDWKWTWGQVVAIAGLITSGVFDVQHWMEYVGLHISVTQLHTVQVVALAILWISGQMNTSGLYSKQVMEAAKVTNLHPEVMSEKIKVEEVKQLVAENPQIAKDSPQVAAIVKDAVKDSKEEKGAGE